MYSHKQFYLLMTVDTLEVSYYHICILYSHGSNFVLIKVQYANCKEYSGTLKKETCDSNCCLIPIPIWGLYFLKRCIL